MSAASLTRFDVAFDGRVGSDAWEMAEKFGKVRRHSRTGKLYLCFGRHGKIWSLKENPWKSALQAEQILRAIQGDVARGTPKRAAVEKWLPTAARQRRVSRWLDLWLDDLRSREKSGEISPTYLREIERWAKPGPHGYIAALGARPIDALGMPEIRRWQGELRDLGVSGKTLWNVTAGLGAFLGFLVDEQAITTKPRMPWPRYDEHLPAIVSPAVQDRIMAAIPDDRRGIFLAMMFLGLRHGEAFALDGSDYRDGRLWVRRARKGRALTAPVRGTKNRRARVLFVPDELAEWIAQHVSRETLLEGGPLFRNPRTGKAWALSSFRRTWAKACKAAGFVPPLKSYETLRHSTATQWLRDGATEREVQYLLGHATAHSTPRYARLAEGRLESIVGRRNKP